MEQLTKHRALSLLALPDGIIYAYCLEQNEDQYKIGFKMISFDTGKISSVTKSIFMLTKFGADYKHFIKNIKNYLTCFSFLMENGQVFVVEKDGNATLYGSGGVELWQGKMLYQNTPPGGIAVVGESLWVSYPECNVLVRYNLRTLREELRIGGSNSPFLRAEGLFPAGSKLFVCNTGSQSIWKLDISTFQTEPYFEFTEPVYDYKFVNKYEIASLDSGLYLL